MKNMFGSCGCLALAGGLVLALSSPVAAQSKAGSTPAASDNVWNKYSIGVYGGEQFWRLSNDPNNTPNGHLAPGPAIGVRADQDFFSHIGLEESWTFWAENNLRLTPEQPWPDSWVGFGARNGQLYVGPLFYLSRPSSNIRPYLTVGPALEYFRPTFLAQRQAHDNAAYNELELQTKWGPAMGFGGGVKFRAGDHLDFRLDLRGTFSENPHWNLPPTPVSAGNLYLTSGGTQLGLLASVGIDFGWHKEAPQTKICHGKEIPYTETCPACPCKPETPEEQPCPACKITVSSVNADHTTVCPGEAVHVTATTDAPANATYHWTINGESAGEEKALTFDTSNRAAGTYTLAVTVSAPEHESGTGSTSVTVEPYAPPTGTLSANPNEIWLGEKSTLSVSGLNGHCGGTVHVDGYTASEGTVSDSTYDSTGVQLGSSACSEQRKEVTVTAHLKDDKNEGTATTTIVVKKKQEAPAAEHVADILFARNSARVNNCGKRVLLEELKNRRDSDPNGKVVLIGHFDKGEMKRLHLDEKRAMNAAAVLTAGTGICANFNTSQVLLKAVGEEQAEAMKPHFCESSVKERSRDRIRASDKRAEYRRVEVWWIPNCGELPASAAGAKDAGEMGVSKLGCPR
jgi:hypothetical protein